MFYTHQLQSGVTSVGLFARSVSGRMIPLTPGRYRVSGTLAGGTESVTVTLKGQTVEPQAYGATPAAPALGASYLPWEFVFLIREDQEEYYEIELLAEFGATLECWPSLVGGDCGQGQNGVGLGVYAGG